MYKLKSISFMFIRTYVRKSRNIIPSKVEISRDSQIPINAEEFDHEDLDEFEMNINETADYYDKHKSEVKYKKDLLQYKIAEKKCFENEKEPNFLTFLEKKQIKHLHETDPKEWSITRLSDSFPALPATIKKMDNDIFDDPHLKHLFDGHPDYNVYDNNNVNMSVGAPGPDVLKYCPDMMNKATKYILDKEAQSKELYLFQYGTTPGLWECREEIAKFLSRRYNDSVERKNLFLTCGATHGIQLLLNNILSPNGVIFVEEFTYMIALEVFKQFPLMKIISIPMKDDVVDIDAFETIVAENKIGNYLLNDQKIFWAMFYTIPTFHNPTGMVIPPENCKRLVEIARANSILVVCDDVYNLLNYESSFPPRRLISYDDPKDIGYKSGNIVSNGSFSKIFSPAIRLGWMECSPRIMNILKNSAISRSGGAVNHYISGVIASLLHNNAEDKYLDMLIKTYKERLAAVCFVLDSYLPKCCSYRRPQGGYFLWLHLPTEVNSQDFVIWCQKKYKIITIPGIRFSYTGLRHNYLRLSIAFYPKDKLMNAMKLLCKGLDDYINNQTIDDYNRD